MTLQEQYYNLTGQAFFYLSVSYLKALTKEQLLNEEADVISKIREVEAAKEAERIRTIQNVKAAEEERRSQEKQREDAELLALQLREKENMEKSQTRAEAAAQAAAQSAAAAAEPEPEQKVLTLEDLERIIKTPNSPNFETNVAIWSELLKQRRLQKEQDEIIKQKRIEEEAEGLKDIVKEATDKRLNDDAPEEQAQALNELSGAIKDGSILSPEEQRVINKVLEITEDTFDEETYKLQVQLGNIEGIDVEALTQQNYLNALSRAAAKKIYKQVENIIYSKKPSYLKDATVAYFTINKTKKEGPKPSKDSIENIRKYINYINNFNKRYQNILITYNGFNEAKQNQQTDIILNILISGMLEQTKTIRSLKTYGIEESDIKTVLDVFYSKFDGSMIPVFDKVREVLYSAALYKDLKNKIKILNNHFLKSFAPEINVPT